MGYARDGLLSSQQQARQQLKSLKHNLWQLPYKGEVIKCWLY